MSKRCPLLTVEFVVAVQLALFYVRRGHGISRRRSYLEIDDNVATTCIAFTKVEDLREVRSEE